MWNNSIFLWNNFQRLIDFDFEYLGLSKKKKRKMIQQSNGEK